MKIRLLESQINRIILNETGGDPILAKKGKTYYNMIKKGSFEMRFLIHIADTIVQNNDFVVHYELPQEYYVEAYRPDDDGVKMMNLVFGEKPKFLISGVIEIVEDSLTNPKVIEKAQFENLTIKELEESRYDWSTSLNYYVLDKLYKVAEKKFIYLYFRSAHDYERRKSYKEHEYQQKINPSPPMPDDEFPM